MLQQTKMSRKDEIVLKMEEQIRIVTLCHNCHFRNLQSNAGANLRGFNKNMVNHVKSNALKVQMARKKQDDLMAKKKVKGMRKHIVDRKSQSVQKI